VAHFADSVEGMQRVDARAAFPRHRHATAYAAIVVSGGYQEAGERGRYNVVVGDVLIHDTFEPHCDRFTGASVILNLQLPPSHKFSAAHGRVRDLNRLVRCAERNDGGAAIVLAEEFVTSDSRNAEDWPDLLAADLCAQPTLRLTVWAEEYGLAPETISRGFFRAYGVTPARFRAEARTRRAWQILMAGGTALTALALQTGFSDQAHMTRAMHALTGRSPGAWRKSNPFKKTAVSVH
jgi:AraC-like DNA-binding protein